MKKFTSMILSMLMVLSLFTTVAFAEETVTINIIRGEVGSQTMETIIDSATDLTSYIIKSPQELGIETYGETPTIDYGMGTPANVGDTAVFTGGIIAAAIVNYKFTKAAPETYSIKCTNCSVTNSPLYGGVSYGEGEEVVVTAFRIDGQIFTGFSVNGGSVTLSEIENQPYQRSFTMQQAVLKLLQIMKQSQLIL